VRLRVAIGSGIAVLAAACAAAFLWWSSEQLAVEQTASTPTVAADPPRSVKPAPIAPSFDIVKIGPGGTAVIAGRAAPGAEITVLDGGKPLGVVTADGRGEWVLVPTAPLDPGDRTLSLEAINPQKGEKLGSETTVALSVPAAAKPEAATLAVALPTQGAARILQMPETAAPSSLALETVEYGAGVHVALSGRAPPGATVRVYLGNRLIAAPTAGARGRWSATTEAALAAGGELRLDQLAGDGSVAARLALNLAPAASLELKPGQTYVVQRGNNLWQVAYRAYGAGARYVTIYAANQGQIRNPHLIYPGQIIAVPKW
jgi:nucleoid-associated protein YgaU